MRRALAFGLPLLACGLCWVAPAGAESCNNLAASFRTQAAAFKQREQRYLRVLKCSLDAWKNYQRYRGSLLQVRGIARKAAQAALRDLDARNAKLRAGLSTCQKERQALEDAIRAYNARLRQVAARLAQCRIAIPPIPMAYREDYKLPK